jgi:hypothetical protein
LFAEEARILIDEEGLRHLQNTLMETPGAGVVMPGCGGLRKIRVEQPRRSKGKRGGCRVIYLHIPAAARLDLIAIYGKNDKDDLSATEKNILRVLAEQAKREAVARVHRRGKHQ